MTTWGDFRAQLRNSVLKDPEQISWSDDDLALFTRWALDQFCAHTAAETGFVISPVTSIVYPLPENLYESLEETGYVYLKSSQSIINVEPREFPEDRNAITFRTWAGNLELSSLPPAGYDLHVRHFAYYNYPVLDSDTIDIPRWAFPALSYLIAAFAMTPIGTQAANLGQWDTKADAGNPEHNPLRRQQEWYMKLYERELLRHPRQNRTHYFKSTL